MTVQGVTGTFEQLRAGVESPDGKYPRHLVWQPPPGNNSSAGATWTVNWDFTLDNYQSVLGGRSYTVTNPDGTTEEVPGQNMSQAFFNSLAVSIPSTIIPILIAAFAAYGFAWMNFPGRQIPVYHGGGFAGRAAANCPGAHPAGLQQAGLERYLPGGLAGAHRLWLAPGDLPAVTTTSAPCPARFWNRRLSTAPPTLPSLPAWCCRYPSRPWPPLPSSSSCGCGTTTWSPWSSSASDPNFKVVTQRLADMTGTFGNALAAADRRRVCHHAPAAGCLLRLAALLCARPAGRLGQRIGGVLLHIVF